MRKILDIYNKLNRAKELKKDIEFYENQIDRLEDFRVSIIETITVCGIMVSDEMKSLVVDSLIEERKELLRESKSELDEILSCKIVDKLLFYK